MYYKKFPLIRFWVIVFNFFLAFILSFYLRNSWGEFHELSVYIKVLPIVLPIYLLSVWHQNLFTNPIVMNFGDRCLRFLKAISIFAFVIMALAYLQKFDYSRFLLGFFIASILGLNCISDYFIYHIFQKFLISKKLKIYLVGDLKNWQTFFSQSSQSFQKYLVTISQFDLLNIKSLPDEMSAFDCDEVWVWGSSENHSKLPQIFHTSTPFNLRIFRTFDPEIDSDLALNKSLIYPVNQNSYKFYRMLIKPLIDVLGALCLLLIFLPVSFIITIKIRRDSPGNVLFSHHRVGLLGQEFILHKFRTMHSDVKAQDFAPLHPADQRVTKFGRLLRRSSLDELPQLWNVLKGEMSLVGPRPEMPFIVANYADWQLFRLKMKPGITGLWQIHGRKDLPLSDNLHFDWLYLWRRSLVDDLKIILKTVKVVIRGTGAY